MASFTADVLSAADFERGFVPAFRMEEVSLDMRGNTSVFRYQIPVKFLRRKTSGEARREHPFILCAAAVRELDIDLF
jgi:hypothetical protein